LTPPARGDRWLWSMARSAYGGQSSAACQLLRALSILWRCGLFRNYCCFEQVGRQRRVWYLLHRRTRCRQPHRSKRSRDSHAEGDEERFYSVALQVAAQAARQWHGRFAQALRDVVDQARAKAATPVLGQRVRPVPMVQPRGELAGLLTVAHPKTRLAEMVLAPGVRRRLERVLTE